ncbi:MAG: class I SAM-dependent methyltransferase [Eubacterium sp.]|nr:class I SAM-dependent methyltransferase [Eubacterium sp.]
MRCDSYKDLFSKEYLMGPNSMRLLDELIEKYPIDTNLKIMDLGCGKGITSFFLSKEFNANVYATDLWCSATENYEQFKKWGIDNNVVPIHADAHDLPYANNYFDLITTIDSFHYFSTEPGFFESKILPLVKSSGYVYIAMPGLKKEVHGKEDNLVLEWLGAEESEYELFHSIDWWKNHLNRSDLYELVDAFELTTGEKAWQDWFDSEHEYSASDKEYFAKGLNNYLNVIGFIIKKL